MTLRVKVSSNNQIAVPAKARERLGISKGDYLLVEIRDGSILLVPEPADYVEHLRGLHSEVWEGIDTEEYLRREREAWET
jgi:AbrB family looped-hinge helix DNA binding protein